MKSCLAKPGVQRKRANGTARPQIGAAAFDRIKVSCLRACKFAKEGILEEMPGFRFAWPARFIRSLGKEGLRGRKMPFGWVFEFGLSAPILPMARNSFLNAEFYGKMRKKDFAKETRVSRK